MKKLGLMILAVVAMCASVALAYDTITAQDATKTGLEGFRTKVNANFAAISTNGVEVTKAQVTNAVPVVTNFTYTVYSTTGYDSTGAAITNTAGVSLAIVTNVVITIQR